MNEIILSGKILNSYLNDNGYYTCTVAVVHDHIVDGFNIPTESVFRAFLMDKHKSQNIMFAKGDKVEIKGYLKQDHLITRGGNEHKKVNLYISTIKLAKSKA